MYQINQKGSTTHSEFGCVSIVRHGDTDLDVVRCGPSLKLRLSLDHVFRAGSSVVLDNSLDPDERLNVGLEAIGHELKLTIRWDE